MDQLAPIRARSALSGLALSRVGEGILITGGSGLLGLGWAFAARDRCRVVLGLHRRVVRLRGVEVVCPRLDDVQSLRATLRALRPARVVHAAGLADVERCEAEPERAHAENVVMAERVAAACVAEGVGLVHVSTDHLFRGDRAMLDESAEPDPVNVYGRTKAEAERCVLTTCPDALVVRTNFFGWGPGWRRSFSDFVIDACRGGQAVRLWTDVLHTPISVPALVRSVERLVDLGTRGIVHVVGDERISKYDFGVAIANRFGLDATLLRPSSAHDAPGRTRRPMDMSLSNRHLVSILGHGIGPVDRLLHDLGQAPPEELGRLE